MSIDTDKVSILHWTSSEKHKCGYCGSKNSISHGLWAESLTVEDYQNMIDRGWRRSGKYCYKPIMNETCCPQYTIRCAALNFKPTKSQKKVLKKFNKCLKEGHKPTNSSQNHPQDMSEGDGDVGDGIPISDNNIDFVMPSTIKEIGNNLSFSGNTSNTTGTNECKLVENLSTESTSQKIVTLKQNINNDIKKEVKKGVGADLSLPKCQKAKFLRNKRREEKLLRSGQLAQTSVAAGKSANVKEKPKVNGEKSLRDLINDELMENVHNIQVKLIRPKGADWHQYRKVEFELYKKYQVCIHKDPAGKCTMQSFEHFLADSPLQISNPAFGSFHQQYWLDSTLIAVGVIDILPKCVSSVYLFYDPDYNYLTLGTYSALREVEFTQRLHIKHPSIEYYYMGFYIHTCTKMRYKGKFVPSDLLCPETYAWTPIAECLPLLEVSKYARLQAAGVRDVEMCVAGPLLDAMKIIVDYSLYRARQLNEKEEFAETFVLLGKLLGKKLIGSVYIVF